MTPQYTMSVDLNRCVGCQTCTIACKHANDTLPGVQWRTVLDVEAGRYPDVQRLFLVVGCQHCAEPPCVPVCPTGATFQREDGLVAMDYDRCIGCGYCAVACPYQARTIAHEQSWYFGESTVQERRVEHPERIGVAQKCTFCVEKIDQAEALDLVPGLDLEVTPACASSCIAQAIQFGNLDDPNSPVSRALEGGQSFQMHAELGTEPRIHYLYEAPAATGAPDANANEPEEEEAVDGLAGAHQAFWDLRAGANFTLGGLGSGLAVAAALIDVFAVLPGRNPAIFHWLAAALIAIGLLAVFSEIGRKSRFLYALACPRTSWMTREVYAAGVFFPAVLVATYYPDPIAHLIVGAAAAAFLYCQGGILHAAKGIPAWRAPLMPALLVASGLFEGVGLLAISTGLLSPAVSATFFIALFGTLLAAVNALSWWRYRRWLRDNRTPAASRRVLDALTPWLHGLGHLAPLVLFIAAFVWRQSAFAETLLIAAGVAVVGGGVTWKLTLITRAGFQQGFALGRWPQRGSGRRAARGAI